jgi:uncharacterized protein YndB with AHSA1/START domain
MARVLVLKRAFDANPNVVFAAWTSEERLLRWFGMDSCMIDARAGGMFRFALRFPDGADRWVRGNYLEVVDGERIVFTSAEEDRNGAPGHETLVTVTLIEQEGRTFLTLHQAVFESLAQRDAQEAEWIASLDRLAAMITSE